MAIRIKSTWHQSQRNVVTAKQMVDNGRALAFIVWRLALEHAKSLHKEGFEYQSDRERVRIITEIAAFCVQVVDRLAHGRVSDQARAELVGALGTAIADQVQDNLSEIAGPGNYRRPFIDCLNERLQVYAHLSFADGQPGFDFLRYFGRCALDVMGETQANRWVMDQIMEVVAPELLDQTRRSLDNLIGTSS